MGKTRRERTRSKDFSYKKAGDSLIRDKGEFNAFMRKRVYEVVHPPTGRKPPPQLIPLQELTIHELAEVFLLLVVRGRPEEFVAEDIIQKKFKKMKEFSTGDLTLRLRYFKVYAAPIVQRLKRMLGITKDRVLKKEYEQTKEELVGMMEKRDALAEAHWALSKQKERLEAIMTREKNSNYILMLAQKDIDLYHRQCMDILKKEMELGIRDMMPTKLDVSLSHTFAGVVGDVRKTVPGGVDRMVEGTRKLIEHFKQTSGDGIDLPAIIDAEVEDIDG